MTVPTAVTEADEFTFDDVNVVMGTYDEEAAVGPWSTTSTPSRTAARVVCVDGSADRTPEIAAERGARMIQTAAARVRRRGARGALAHVSAGRRHHRLRRHLPDGATARDARRDQRGVRRGDGDRLYHGADAMPRLSRRGNRAFAALASLLLGRRVHDVTTGMRAYRREVITSVDWTENTGLSAELIMRSMARGYDVRELPIDYRERRGTTTLDPLTGGLEIAASIVRVGLEERYDWPR